MSVSIVLRSAPDEPTLGPDTPKALREYIAGVRAWAREVEKAIRLVASQVGATVTDGGSGGGDFMADGSVPMTGVLEMGSHNIQSALNIQATGDIFCHTLFASYDLTIGGNADGNNGFFQMLSGSLDANYDGFNLYRGGSQKWFVGQGNASLRGTATDFLYYDAVLGDVSFWSPQGSGVLIVNNGLSTEVGDITSARDVVAARNASADNIFICAGTDGVSGSFIAGGVTVTVTGGIITSIA